MANRIAGYQHTQKRRDLRLNQPGICVVIDGCAYETEDWSLGGALIKSYSGKLEENDTVTVEGIGSLGGEIFQVNVNAKVARLGSDKNLLAVAFTGIDENVFDIMQSLMRRGGAISGA
ncbi:MAG: PilZ domain-containing protein [Rhodospirillales bacterium]|nr:PilZ domain-containing protein [Rhodospirillales bacterium]